MVNGPVKVAALELVEAVQVEMEVEEALRTCLFDRTRLHVHLCEAAF